MDNSNLEKEIDDVAVYVANKLKNSRNPKPVLVGQEADIAVDASLAVDDAVVRRLVNDLTGIGVNGVNELITQLRKFIKGLLLVAIVIHIAHRAVLALKFKHHPILHKHFLIRLPFKTESTLNLVDKKNHYNHKVGKYKDYN